MCIYIYIIFVWKEKRKMAGSKGGDKLVISKSNHERVSFSKEFISISKKAEEIYSFPVSSL